MSNATMSKAQDDKKGAIFNIIRNQMISALKDNETKGSLKFYKGLPTNVIDWLQRQGVARFNGLDRTPNKGKGAKYIYTVYYTDLDKYSAFLKDYVERLEKKGYIAESNPVTVKFMKIHDYYRDELECPNFSSEKDETGYAPCPENVNGGVERLTRADDIVFEMFVQSLNYENYLEYERYDHDEDVINELYEQFRNETLVKEYQQGEEDEFTEEELDRIFGKEKEEVNV